MRSKTLLLTKIQLMEQFRPSEIVRKGNKKSIKHFLFIVFTFLILAILAAYSYLTAIGFVFLGLAAVLPGFGLAFSAIITIFFTILKTNGVLFNGKDYDILMALPVKTSAVISSRFLTMYFMNLGCTLLVLFPMQIALMQYGVLSLVGSVFWFLGSLLAPLFPTTIASLVGAVIAWIASKFRHSNAVVSVISIFLVVGIIVFSFSMGQVSDTEVMLDSITTLGQELGDSINQIYPIAAFFSGAVLDGNFLSLLLFVGFSIGWYMAFIWLLSKKYKKINTALATHRVLANYKMTTLQKKSAIKALYQKELKRFLSTNVYLMNLGIGSIMLLVCGVACLFISQESIESIFSISGQGDFIKRIIPFIFSAMIGMSCTTCVSLSFEGKNIWILKSLPISPKTVFQSKILVNLTLVLPCSIISSSLVSFRFAENLIDVVIFFVLPIIYCFFIATWGMFIDIKMCKYEWSSETALCKQSANMLCGSIVGMLMAIIPIFVILTIKSLNTIIVMIIASLIYLCVTLVLYKKICSSVIPD